MELNYAFWGVWGVWGGVCNQKSDKWPPIEEKSQITQKSIMKAVFCSLTHTKTYFEGNISRGVFHRVFWGYRGGGRGMCDQKGKKWPPTGKKSQITQKSNMKALYCSHTHTTTYFEENISRGVFQTVFWGVWGVWGGMCNQKGDKWPPIGEKLQITQKSNMKALYCSHTQTKTYFEENTSTVVFHTVFWGVWGVGWLKKIRPFYITSGIEPHFSHFSWLNLKGKKSGILFSSSAPPPLPPL